MINNNQIENPNIGLYGILAFNFYCDVTINRIDNILNVTSQLSLFASSC